MAVARGWRYGWLLALAAIVVLGSCRQNVPAPAAVDPSTMSMAHRGCNVVWISFDALQAAHVGCLGNARDVTPTLDAFAEQSFCFTQNMSVASWTVPSSMSWFTGVYPTEHGLTNKFAVYAPPEKRLATLHDKSPGMKTLAEILQAQGYATGGFSGNAGVSAVFGFGQGFDVYVHDTDRFGSFDQSVPRALEWLKANRDRKFFLFLHGYDAHGQCTPGGGFDYRFVEPNYDRKFTGSAQEQETLREEGIERGELTLRDADVRFWRAIYDEKIQRADARLAQFLKEYDQLGLADKTLFIITSDHGTEFYEHRRVDHGFTLYDEQIHVPLLVKLPGQAGGKRITQRVSSLDIMPTILELLQLAMPSDAQTLRGASLVATMQGAERARDLFAETDYRKHTFKRAIITPSNQKLIFTLESKQRELFDLVADPGEQHNLASEQPALADELEAKLFAHYAAIGHDLRSQSWQRGFNPVYNFQRSATRSP